MSTIENQIYTLNFNNISAANFGKLSSAFAKDPGSVTTNPMATYKLIDRDGSGGASINDHVDIDIVGPDNGSVVIQDFAANSSGFVAKFATLEGHTDAGWIYFSAMYDKKSNGLTFSINNTTRTNTGMSLTFIAPLVSRAAQKRQWNIVMSNVVRLLNTPATSATQTISNPASVNQSSTTENVTNSVNDRAFPKPTPLATPQRHKD